jgi:hypothetical protein
LLSSTTASSRSIFSTDVILDRHEIQGSVEELKTVKAQRHFAIVALRLPIFIDRATPPVKFTPVSCVISNWKMRKTIVENTGFLWTRTNHMFVYVIRGKFRLLRRGSIGRIVVLIVRCWGGENDDFPVTKARGHASRSTSLEEPQQCALHCRRDKTSRGLAFFFSPWRQQFKMWLCGYR